MSAKVHFGKERRFSLFQSFSAGLLLWRAISQPKNQGHECQPETPERKEETNQEGKNAWRHDLGS